MPPGADPVSSVDRGARTLIRLTAASLGYGRSPVLPPLDLELQEGDFLGLVGPNGSGKTTILRAMLGLLRPLSGRVEIRRSEIRFGYVPQQKSLADGWPLRVEDVVLMGLMDRVGLIRRPGPRERDRARQALDAVSMGEMARQRFDTLSGGQKQRVLMARALAGEPQILLLDEPTAGMDLAGSQSIISLLHRLHRRSMTIVMVTHQLNEVANAATRVALVTEDGLRVGKRDEILTEANLSDVYRIPVGIAQVNGDLVIVPKENGNDLPPGGGGG